MAAPDPGVELRRLTEDEIQVLKSLLGQTILSVDHEEQGEVESAYLRFDSMTVELAARELGDDAGQGFPWRISPRIRDLVIDPLTSPLLADLADVGFVSAIDVLEDDYGVEDSVVFVLRDDRKLLAYCAGGDYVAATFKPSVHGRVSKELRSTG
jgi:hypothetical protein